MTDFLSLSKTYGAFDAVQSLTLTVERGEVFGFLGPNGAGKTTTIRMMIGILVPSSGHVTIDGLDCHGWAGTAGGEQVSGMDVAQETQCSYGLQADLPVVIGQTGDQRFAGSRRLQLALGLRRFFAHRPRRIA